MKHRASKPRKKQKDVRSPRTNEVVLEPAGEVVVEHQAIPPSAPAGLKIHARRPLPSVPDAAAKADKESDKKDG